MSSDPRHPAPRLKDEARHDLNLDGPLWRFALDFYARPGVAAACLTLQDDAGVDAIHLLQVIFADVILRRPLPATAIAIARQEMARWRDTIVLPLRAVRRALKTPPPELPAAAAEALRSEVKRLELKAEQMQLALAEDWLARESESPGLSLPSALDHVVACSGGAVSDHGTALGVLCAAAAAYPRAEPSEGEVLSGPSSPSSPGSGVN